jgi:hypothetical protein
VKSNKSDRRNPVKSWQSDKVGVVRTNGEYRLVACKTILANEDIFQIKGEYAEHPSRYSIQIGKRLHIDLVSGINAEDALDHYYWRYMNHSCSPSAYISDCMVIALRKIYPWEEITFNYNTMEYDLAEPFECRCKCESCIGKIQGFKYLSIEERNRLKPFIAPYLDSE